MAVCTIRMRKFSDRAQWDCRRCHVSVRWNDGAAFIILANHPNRNICFDAERFLSIHDCLEWEDPAEHEEVEV